ncbi:MAG: indolepyruvate oxidoreductase subunit beta [Deltaproteobacteria bacterium]|jgi:indolepyruvate ferredoxin oxidoreductase beta subunit|nr:indolepyruvate oxidoreductase subunit beta [Deltaproteobacteria bacterium]
MMKGSDNHFKLLVTGVGGQGVLTITGLLGNSAMAAGLEVMVGQLHGMSQRGGDVSSTVVIGQANTSIIGKGEADVVVGLEPLEVMRALPQISSKTKVLLSNNKVMPFPMAFRGVAYPPLSEIIGKIKKFTDQIYEIDSLSLIKQIGSFQSLNFIMLGALTALDVLPFEEKFLWETLKSRLKPELIELNKKAFMLGKEAIRV